MNEEKVKVANVKGRLRLSIERLAILLVLGPFASVLLFALAGQEMPTKGWFSIWFIGSFLFCCVFVLIDELSGLWRKKTVEWGCAIPLAFVTWWAAILLLRDLEYLQ
jgi:hypothetical protein